MRIALLLPLALALGGCPSPPADEGDSGVPTDEPVDDGGAADAGPTDGGLAADAGVEDAGADDAGAGDAGLSDGGEGHDAGPGDAGCPMPVADLSGTATLQTPLGEAAVTVDPVGQEDACERTYALTTTQPLRDGLPANPRTVAEEHGAPTLRSGHLLFDALYALALEEVRECSVEAISDGAFAGGAPTSCGEGGCFETGRLWKYVWTRDTAYAVDLGLAALDPQRSRNSLEFKLSERRGGGDLQVVQDTGSGGSYPVSSDRVAWAVGAWELYVQLEGEARETFGARAYEALKNTLEHDRGVVYDPADGLYRGEQSFLDWREQSYPEWTGDDVVHLAMSKALSTNLLHMRAMEVAAALAEASGDVGGSERYASWAAALREAIRDRLWLDDEGLYSTHITTGLDPSPARRYDLLGSALAVLFGAADEAQAASILSRYPHYGPGAPVLWPQQQHTPIYHNRGEWPFVTAYWLRAARRADNDAVADRMTRALLRGAALNLSHMENFEAASGAPWVDDGDASGPVVNSQRQLWSVAGYLSMVHHTLFGLEAQADSLVVRPYVTRGLRNSLFAGTDELVLHGYPYRGRRLTVALHLPPVGGQGGSYGVGEVRLDGALVQGGEVLPAALAEHSRVDVTLVNEGDRPPAALEERDDGDWREVFSPRTPRISSVGQAGGRVRLSLSTNGEDAATVRFFVYRDGALVAGDLPGTTTEWTDAASDAAAPASPCYVVETCFAASGNCSQRSPPSCWWGEGGAAVQEISAAAFENVGGVASSEHGRFHYGSWGDEGHELSASFTAARTGEHLLQLDYGNGAGPIDTGVTCAVKRVTVTDTETGATVGEGVVVMPHLGDWSRWAGSSFLPVALEDGKSYRVVIGGDEGTVNMSAFEHFELYTGGLGGEQGAFNRVNISALKVLAR